MATINFVLLSEKENAQIYARVYISSKHSWKKKTGLFVNPKDWNKKKGYPKPSASQTKILHTQLSKLNSDIQKWINESRDYYVEDLEKVISESLNKKNTKDDKSLNTFVKKFLKYEDTLRLSESSLKKYTTLQNKLIAFDPKSRYSVNDVDLRFRDKFIKFLKDDGVGDNTIGRYLKVIITFVLSAEKNGYKISGQFKSFKGYTVKAEKIILSFDEIETLKKTEYDTERLTHARDWLVISCYTGQRVSDLLRMNTGMITEIKGYRFIILTQTKTKKIVHIPLHKEVEDIIKIYDGFPPLFSNKISSNSVEYNELLKEVSEQAELNEMVLGNLYDKKKGKFIKKEYEKWRLISSHIGRRSFATNFYAQEKYPTPILMSITGHSTEKMFLEYIGKKPVDYALQLAKIWAKE